MTVRNALLLLVTCLFFASCIDEINLKINTNQPKLIVDGLIADSLQEYVIKVNYSAVIGVGTDNIMTPVEGASVVVKEDAGSDFAFAETTPGVYVREMAGEVGKTYHIEITLPDGSKAMSLPTVLLAAPPIDSVNALLVERETFNNLGNLVTEKKVELHMNTSVANLPERPFLRWRAFGEYEYHEFYVMAFNLKTCYIKENADNNNIAVFDTRELASGVLNDEPFLETNLNYRFASQYCFSVYQYAISEDEYKYWKSVDAIINIDGSLFDPPPGTVRGNLYNPEDPEQQVLGYFSVCGASSVRKFVNGTSIGAYVAPRCSNNQFQGRPPECYNCLLLFNSSTDRPDYWIP